MQPPIRVVDVHQCDGSRGVQPCYRRTGRFAFRLGPAPSGATDRALWAQQTEDQMALGFYFTPKGFTKETYDQALVQLETGLASL